MSTNYDLMTNDELNAKLKDVDDAFKVYKEMMIDGYKGMVDMGEEYEAINNVLKSRGLGDGQH